MELAYLLAVFLFVLVLLLGSGIWVGLALMGVGGVIMTLFTDNPAGDVMITAVWSSSTSWTLTALPLFILMGEILFRTRLSEDLFRALAPIMNKLPGGLLHTNIVGSALFAAVSGSSAATLTTVGKMSIPELRRRNYPEKKIIGTLAGAATLGLMIPPSLTLIVYGVTVNESITKLFMAGIIPGILLATMFMAYVAISVKAPATERSEANTGENGAEQSGRIENLRLLLPLLALISAVIGSMYSGLATATEAAAIGVIGSLVLSAIQGELSFDAFWESLLGAVRTSALIALILMGASYLSVVMGFTGLPRALAEYIGSLGLSPVMLLAALALLYVVIGMFLDGISSIVLTMAVVEPLVRMAGIDIIWFGIFIVVVVEMAQITPPVGFNLFVMQGMTGHQISYISRAAFPMFLIMVLMIVLLIAFPGIATWLSTAVQ
jgi:C4-dicarboxylate transporter DctM subunit